MEKRDRESVTIHLFKDLYNFGKLDSHIVKIIADHMGVDGKELCRDNGIIYNDK